MTSRNRWIILKHLLDAHVHLSVAYYGGTNEAGKYGLEALHRTEDAIGDLMRLEVKEEG